MTNYEPSLLAHIGRIIIFSMPTVVTYFSICHSPTLSAKLVGTAVQDFITNIIIGIMWSFRVLNYDPWFKVVVLFIFLIILFIKIHTSHVFLLQLAETPVKKDFQDSIKKSLGAPPVVKFVEYKTASAINSPYNSQSNSRQMSPVVFEYDTWQDLTALPEVKYSEHLKVTTATNCYFTDNAKKEIAKQQEELRKKLKPHRNIATEVSCPGCTDYFVSNTSKGSEKILRLLASRPALLIYNLMILIGYRLWFEFLYFKSAKEVKVQLYKCIGVKGDNLRVKRGENDKVAQENFQLYLNAADKQGTIAHK